MGGLRLLYLLVILEDVSDVVAHEVEGERVGVHQRPSAIAENVDGLLKELSLNPGESEQLHLLGLLLCLAIELK